MISVTTVFYGNQYKRESNTADVLAQGVTGRNGMYRHILIPTDGSELSRRAVQHGLELAKAVGAKATALTVEGSFDVYTVPASRVYEMSGAFAEHAARARAPARSTINPGVGVILAALAPDDEEIRRARFAQEQLAERF